MFDDDALYLLADFLLIFYHLTGENQIDMKQIDCLWWGPCGAEDYILQGKIK